MGRGGLEAQNETTVNIPLPAGTGDAGYLAAWDELVAPPLAGFAPGAAADLGGPGRGRRPTRWAG